MLAFYSRYKAATGDSRYDGEASAGLKELFPKGVERVAKTDFNGLPTSGVRVNEENSLLKKAGLATGDIIAALYGIRVHNLRQYLYAIETKDHPEMELIVWKRAGGYVQVKTSPPEHRFNANLNTYLAQ